MSNIKKSEQWHTKCDVIVHAMNLTLKLESVLKISYGYSQERYERTIKAMTRYIADPEKKKEVQERLLNAEEEYNLDFVEREREFLRDLARQIMYACNDANTIHPIYYQEWLQRRCNWNRALELCNDIQLELNIIAKKLPTDKNSYMELVGEYESLFGEIKNIRQANNSLLKNLKDYDLKKGMPLISVNSPSSNFCNVNENGNANNNNANNTGGVRP